jgi:hypothetical protein
MTTDLYTKAVLTVIAIALSGIAIQLTIKEAHAQSQSAKFSSKWRFDGHNLRPYGCIRTANWMDLCRCSH